MWLVEFDVHIKLKKMVLLKTDFFLNDGLFLCVGVS